MRYHKGGAVKDEVDEEYEDEMSRISNASGETHLVTTGKQASGVLGLGRISRGSFSLTVSLRQPPSRT